MKLVGLALILAACTAHHHDVVAHLPSTAQLSDPDASSSYVVTERLHGKVAVLDFWASWCDECKRTIPQVARLAAALGPDGLVVVGVNAGEAKADALRSASELGISYPIALDPELTFSDALGTTGLPVLVVVDRDGAIVHRAKHVDEETLAIIRALLHDHDRGHR